MSWRVLLILTVMGAVFEVKSSERLVLADFFASLEIFRMCCKVFGRKVTRLLIVNEAS